MAPGFLKKIADYLQHVASHFVVITRPSEGGDGEVLVTNDDDRYHVAPVIVTSNKPRHNWTRPLIFNNLAIVIGTSFISGFYMMAIAKPYGLYPHDRSPIDWGFAGNSLQPLPQRKASAVPLTTLFFHHLLTYYASRLFAYVGPASFMGNKFGRRLTLMGGAVVGFFAVIIGLLSQLCPGKLRDILWAMSTGALGLQNGVGQVIAPAYLIETAPLSIRGACGCFYEVFYWAGVAFAFIAEIDLPGNELALWTFILGLSASLYILQFGMLWFGFESPHWLANEAGRDHEALFVLKKLRQCDSSNALNELNEIKAMVDSRDVEPGCCLCPNNRRFQCCELCRRKVVWPTFLSACLLSANLLTGAPIIYKIQTALLNKDDLVGESIEEYHFPLIFGILLILLYLSIMTIVGFFLVDAIGRRRLVTTGITFMTLAYIPTALGTFHKDAITWQVGTVLFMAAYSFGPGPISTFMAAELFDHRSRLAGSSIAHFVTQLFPVYLAEIYDTQAPYPQLFMPAGVIFCALEMTLLWLFLPETTKLPFDQIVSKFHLYENWLQVMPISRSRPPPPQHDSIFPSITPFDYFHNNNAAAVVNIQMTESATARGNNRNSSNADGDRLSLTNNFDDDSDVNTI